MRIGEDRWLEIASSTMKVIKSHYKKDSSVVSSARFGISATAFTQPGEGLAESNITKYLSNVEGKGKHLNEYNLSFQKTLKISINQASLNTYQMLKGKVRILNKRYPFYK